LGAYIGLGLFIAVIAFEMWGDWSSQSRFQERQQRDLIETQSRDREWASAHPAEAAWLDHMLASLEASQRAFAACMELPEPTKAVDCIAENKRREIMECLSGADWKNCPAMNNSR